MAARFSGIIPPTFTPLDADERLDRPAVKRMMDFLVDGGVDGVFVLGSTGEGPTLRSSVRRDMVDASVEAIAGRVPVIAGVPETATARAIDEVRSFATSGIDGVVASTPFYFAGYSDDELLDHFRRIADATDLPVLIYSIPQLTKVAVSARLVQRLAEIPNVVGIKDSSGNWAEFQAMLLTRTDPSFAVLQGAQSLCAVSLIAGADGLIPAHANMYPRLLCDLLAAVRRGDLTAAFTHQAQLDILTGIRGRASLHANKIVAKALGLIEDHVSSPLPRLTAEEQERILAASVAAGLRLPEKTPALAVADQLSVT
jgi:dihydrodipicolinate synthase/N-acetylneuraminate lyase